MKRAPQTVVLTVIFTLVAASTAFGWGYGRNVVKPQYTFPSNTITVHRTAPNGSPSGPAIGNLWNPQSFSVEKTASSNYWCYGFAYGSVNQKGWVICDQLQLP